MHMQDTYVSYDHYSDLTHTLQLGCCCLAYTQPEIISLYA